MIFTPPAGSLARQYFIPLFYTFSCREDTSRKEDAALHRENAILG
jgi:hypothetical protein